ncbi:MAG: FHIPEP family type III secretion protein [Candidatus Sulfotelmatobacter sp.]
MQERVSARHLPTILEMLRDIALTNKNPVLLVESALQALGRAPVRPLLSESGGLRVVTLDRALEEELSRTYGERAPAEQPACGRRTPPDSWWPAQVGGGAGGNSESGAAVRNACPPSPQAPAGAFSAQDGRALAGEGLCRDRGPVTGGPTAMRLGTFAKEAEARERKRERL